MTECFDILTMRRFAHVYGRHQQFKEARDSRGVRKQQQDQDRLTQEEEDFLARMERLSEER